MLVGSIFTRTNITSPDADATLVPRWDLFENWAVSQANGLSLAAYSTQPGAVLTLRMVFFDENDALKGVSGPVTFVSSNSSDFSSQYMGTPTTVLPTLTLGAFQVAPKVDLVQGSWTLVGVPQGPSLSKTSVVPGKP